MISCLKCGKENQDHYKFCLGCGAELPRNQQRKLTFHDKASAEPVVDEPTNLGPGKSGGAPAPVGPVICPECSYENKTTNRFCASCGYRMLALGAAPAASAVVATPPPEPAPLPAVEFPPSDAHQPVEVPPAENLFASPEVAPAHEDEPPPSREMLASAAVVITALLADGSEAGHFPVRAGTTTVGRDTGSFFGGDGYLSPKHATIQCTGANISVRDEGSLNGTFRKLEPDTPVEVRFGDVIRIGQALLKVEPIDGKPPTADGVELMGAGKDGLVARVALIVGRDSTANAFAIPADGLHLGRERGDILFAEDGYVSGLHCRIAVDKGKLILTDLNSSNGTFIRIREETQIPSGRILLMGQQLYRITLGSEFAGAR